MNQFIKNIEGNLDKLNRVDLNEPLPVNFTQNMINNQPSKIIEPLNALPQNIDSIQMINLEKPKNVDEKENGIINKILNFEYRDIILYILVFILLNNKFIIELIYKIPLIKNMDNPYPNLIIRSLIFGVVIFFIKKFNL
jgi:hypothetical protein